MGLVRGKQVRAGETHTLSFDVESGSARDMVVTVEDGNYTRYLSETVHMTEEKTHYSFDVTFEEDMSVDLKFQLGNIGELSGTEHTVTLSDIQWK